jgi:uncharacterized protein YoxC
MDRIKTIATVTIALALVGILVMFVRLHLKADAMMDKIERIEGLMPDFDGLKERASEGIKKRIDDAIRQR